MPTASRESALTPKQLHAVLDGVQDALFVTDPSGEVIFMNPAAIHLYGFEERLDERSELINLRDLERESFDFRTLQGVPVEDEDLPLVRALRGESYRDVELLVRRTGDADPRVYVFSGSRVVGEPPLSVLTVREETDRWRSERRYRAAFEADPAPSVIVRLADTHIMQVNNGMAELTGLHKRELKSRSLTDLKPLNQNNDLRIAARQLQKGRRIHKTKTRLRHAEGNEVPVLLSARAIEVDGEKCGIFTFLDVSDLETSQREHEETKDLLDTTLREHADESAAVAYLAITDALTGISNRRGLDAGLSDELSRAERYSSTFSILVLDLDHFKAVNDDYGHEMGDHALRAVAQLLKRECREPDLVGRWGGDEFMMVLPETGSAEAREVAFRVRERIEEEKIAGIRHLTTSFGVASYEPGDTADSLFMRADRALYAAKSGGRNRVEVASGGQADA